MADFVQGLDPGKLVLSGAALSFILSPFAAPAYNLPIFLFGALVHESNDAVQSYKLFTGILFASIPLDVVWMLNNEQGGLTKFLLLLLWLLKLPTAATFLAGLRQRGSQFMGLGADASGPTVWSMPGGFTSGSREGYQVVDDEPRGPPFQPPKSVVANSELRADFPVPRGPPFPPKRAVVVAPATQPAPSASAQPSGHQSA